MSPAAARDRTSGIFPTIYRPAPPPNSAMANNFCGSARGEKTDMDSTAAYSYIYTISSPALPGPTIYSETRLFFVLLFPLPLFRAVRPIRSLIYLRLYIERALGAPRLFSSVTTWVYILGNGRRFGPRRLVARWLARRPAKFSRCCANAEYCVGRRDCRDLG